MSAHSTFKLSSDHLPLDLGAQTQKLDVALKWGDLCMDEFSEQVEKEIQLGLPPTSYMLGLDSELKRMQLQHGFVSGLVLPLWVAFAACLPKLQSAVENCEANVAYYKSRMLELQPPPPPFTPEDLAP